MANDSMSRLEEEFYKNINKIIKDNTQEISRGNFSSLVINFDEFLNVKGYRLEYNFKGGKDE